MEKISTYQLFCILTSFEIGTVVLINLGIEAKQDAWLAILIAMFCTLPLIWMYSVIGYNNTGKTWFQMIPHIVGPYLGYPLVVLYIMNFVYDSSRVLRDLSELIETTILYGTPMIVIMFCLMITIVYCLRGGLQTFGRMSEILFPCLIISGLVIWIIIFFSNTYDLRRLTPVLAEGMPVIWKTAFPKIITFPFSQLLVILIFWPSLKNSSKLRKIGLGVLILSGVLITINMINMTSVLSASLLAVQQFPLYSSTRMAVLKDFLDRLDIILIIVMLFGGFIKMGVFLYCATIGTAQLFRLENYRALLIAVATIIIPLASLSPKNFNEHLQIGLELYITYIAFPLYVIIPIIIFCINSFRKKRIRFRKLDKGD